MAAIVTTPVLGLIVMPVIGLERLQVFTPVPLAARNGDEESVSPRVIVIESTPPVTTIVEFTTSETVVSVYEPTISVTLMVIE